MSNAQQVEQQQGQQQDAAAQASPTPEPALELRPDLKAQILGMNPADAGPLAEMLKRYPDLSGRILLLAASQLGNAFVQRAIAIATNARPQPAHGPLSHAEMHEFLDDAPARAEPGKGPLSQAEMHEFLDDAPAGAQPARGPLSQAEMHEFLDDAPARAPAGGPARPRTATQADSPWVAAARAYNGQHSDWAAEFNELTSYRYLDVHGGGDDPDDGRKLDPKLVASWQEQHGLQADGMVGPLTVAKAREVKAKPSAMAAAPQADARPPV